MINIWVVLTIVGGAILAVDLVMTQLRKRARRIAVSLHQTQEEIESHARVE